MDVMEQFEYPLPVLATDTDEIILETQGSCDGSFRMKNTGGSMLSGNIVSNNSSIKFTPEKFSSNDLTVFYSFNSDMYKTGDEINTTAVIMSNGGEKIIRIGIRLMPPAIVTKEGSRITTLEDYAVYSRKYPLAARTLLMSKEFSMWLVSTGCKYMEVYEHIVKDVNKERALENFLVLSKLKKPIAMHIAESKFKISIRPEDKKIYNGIVPIKKAGWGYMEASVRLKSRCPWIKLGSDKITAADFNDADTAILNYYIDPTYIDGKYLEAYIIINGNFDDGMAEKKVKVEVKVLPVMTAVLSKEAFEPSESGVLMLQNNTGEDMPLDISVKDSFIKFEGKRYFINGRAEIPFEIKLTAFQSAQFALKKQPVIYSEIYIKANYNDTVVKKTLPVMIGTA